jgi:hypothetical protein
MVATGTVSTRKAPVKAPAAKPKPAAAAAKPASTPFKSVDDIKLGMIVRDPATGLTGVANMKSQLISGTVQIAIVPEGDGKTMPDGHFIDDFMLEYVGEGVSKKAPSEDSGARFTLGLELEDTISGFRGLAVERTTYLNGCVHYTLQSRERKKSIILKLISEPARAQHFDYKRLKQVGYGVSEQFKPKKVAAVAAVAPKPKPEPAPFKRSATGGPSRSMREAGFR